MQRLVLLTANLLRMFSRKTVVCAALKQASSIVTAFTQFKDHTVLELYLPIESTLKIPEYKCSDLCMASVLMIK